MKLKDYKNIYFVGIGGIGMSSLARYFNNFNINIYGYDKVQSLLCEDLEREGMKIHYTDNPVEISVKREETLVVYTPAIPKKNKEFKYFSDNKFRMLKRSEVLGEITKNHFTIAVAGTHGKTTTSTLLAHILRNCGLDCTAFLGGISSNYNSNFIMGSEKSILVVEADEFDKSFLTLNPDIAIITSVDADHLDVYQNKENLMLAFTDFIDKINKGGSLFLESSISSTLVNRSDVSIQKYSVSEDANYSSTNISITNKGMRFDILYKNSTITDFHLKMGGLYNVSNAVAAISVAKKLNITDIEILKGINSFKGIQRRFETHISNDKIVYIDDYAHHPVEIMESLSAVRGMYPNRKITLVFQPHLYSRTNNFLNEFAISLSKVDELILLEIYAAREEKIYGVSSTLLLSKCNVKKKEVSSLESVVSLIGTKEIDVLLTFGAGSISTVVQSIRNQLL